ncbi:MAG TPA: hypothetical protein DCR59_01170 [Dehalococcoidia bacterium]|nr:hypothetical protein [Dehalococcoidia bacterium]
MEDKQKMYCAVILDGIAEIYSNVKNISGFFPVNYKEVSEIKREVKISLFFFVTDLSDKTDNSSASDYYYGACNSNSIHRKYRLPCSMKAIIELSDLNNQPTIKINKTYYRMGKVRINDFCPPGMHLKDLLSASLIDAGYIPVHSASIVAENEGIMLIGAAGIGKTSILAYAIQNGYSYLADDMTVIDADCNIYPCSGISSIAYESGLEKIVNGKKVKNNSVMDNISSVIPPLKNISQKPYLDINMLFPQSELADRAKAGKVFVLTKGSSNVEKISQEQAFHRIITINRMEFAYSGNQLLLLYSLFNCWPDMNTLRQKEEAAIMNLVTNADCYLCSAPNPQEHFKLINSII